MLDRPDVVVKVRLRRRRRMRGNGCCAAVLMCCTCVPFVAARAQLHVTPYVSAEATYDSNVFDLASRDQAVAETGEPRRNDEIFRFMAGTSADYQWDMQKLYGAVEGRRFLYDYFGQLDHDEYLLSGGFNWRIGNPFDGTLTYRQERSMVPFTELTSVQITMQRERKAGGTFNMIVTPEWRVESGAKNHELVAPLQGEPNYALDENAFNGAIKYIGVERFTAGLFIEYLIGNYQGGPSEDRFNQKTAQLTSTYSISGLTNVGAKIGYTKRQGQAGSDDNASGLTGSLSYVRRLTGKTAVNGEIYRRVNSYVTGANAEVDSGASLGMYWQPTFKTAVSFRYEWTESQFQGQGPANVAGSNRVDHYQALALNLIYQPVYWIVAQPFLRYQDRHSNVEIDGFNEATGGLQITMRFSKPASGKDAGLLPQGSGGS